MSFPLLFKSGRVKDTALGRYLQTVGRGRPEKIKGEKKGDILFGIPSISPLSLHSILIKGLVFISSFPHQRPNLNYCSLVPQIEERILGIGRLADQRQAAAQLNTLNLCLYLLMMYLIKELEGCLGGV